MIKSQLLIFKFLLEKEIKQILRNKFIPRLIFMFPIAAVLIFPWTTNMDVKNMNLVVVDNDKSPISKRLISKIDSSNYFLAINAANIHEAMRHIEEGSADIVLEIPPNFEKNLLKQIDVAPGLYVNAINSSKGVIGSGYLSNIIAGFQDFRTIGEGDYRKPPIEIISKYTFNKNLEYRNFMIPALMVMAVTLICGFLPAFNIVGEKERGNIEQINVTPVSRISFVMAKLLPYWVIGFMILSLSFLLAYIAYGLAPVGSLGLIYLFALIYVFAVSGAGLVISNYSNTMQQAMFVIYFFLLILVLMSGLFTPIESMPDWAMYLTYVNPLRYFIESLRMIFLKGSTLMMIWQNFVAMIIFAIVFNVWAIISYKKRD